MRKNKVLSKILIFLFVLLGISIGYATNLFLSSISGNECKMYVFMLDDIYPSKNTVKTKEKELKSIKTVTKKEKVVVKKKKNTKPKYTNNELKLMSCIIWSEAGNQCYAGKLGVGIVVMNRKKSKSFPNSIKGVIYSHGQFMPTWNGYMSRALRDWNNGKYKKDRNRKECVKSAKEALCGKTYVVYKKRKISFKGVYYFNGVLRTKKFRIQGHSFR